MESDRLSVLDEPGGSLDADDGRQAVLARDHRAMGQQAADLGDQAPDGDEQGRAAGIGEGGDQDVAGLEIGPSDVEDHASTPFDGPGGDSQPGQCTLGQIVAPLDAGDHLAGGGEHPRWREGLVLAECVLSLSQ